MSVYTVGTAKRLPYGSSAADRIRAYVGAVGRSSHRGVVVEGSPGHRRPVMSVETLRAAARMVRHEQEREENLGHIDGREFATWLAVADWLDTAGADLWAHGPLCACEDGCDDCDDLLWMPHVRRALTVARTYLGDASP
jgi:hypothetical protein